MPQWSPEIEVDERLARRLIGDQFPELDLRSMRRFGVGWDNVVWQLDGEVVFRFPQRAIAVPGVEREMAVLPHLAPLLPLPVPVPRFRGRPAHGYPWPFFGSSLLPGVEACEAGLSDEARAGLAPPLAAFLATLHSPAVAGAVAAAYELPDDPMGRAEMARRVHYTQEVLSEVTGLGLWDPPASVSRLLDSARQLPRPQPVAVVHGDLHFRHLLLNKRGRLSAVIDWGDVCRGAPSVDLHLYWSLLPPDARPAFLEVYGAVGDEELLRARVLAIFLCAVLAVYGHREGMQNVLREALGGLHRAALD